MQTDWDLGVRTIGVCLLVALAGCTLPPTDQPEPALQTVTVSVTNDHDESYRLAVTVIPPTVDGVQVSYENGSTRTFDVRSIQELPRTALRNATDLTPLGVEAQNRTVDLDPGHGMGIAFEDVPANATVAYFVSQDNGVNQVRSVGLTTCGEAAVHTELAILMSETGELHASTHCRT